MRSYHGFQNSVPAVDAARSRNFLACPTDACIRQLLAFRVELSLLAVANACRFLASAPSPTVYPNLYQACPSLVRLPVSSHFASRDSSRRGKGLSKDRWGLRGIKSRIRKWRPCVLDQTQKIVSSHRGSCRLCLAWRRCRQHKELEQRRSGGVRMSGQFEIAAKPVIG